MSLFKSICRRGLGAAGRVVGDGHQHRPRAVIEVVGEPVVGAGMNRAHPAESDDGDGDLVGHANESGICLNILSCGSSSGRLVAR